MHYLYHRYNKSKPNSEHDLKKSKITELLIKKDDTQVFTKIEISGERIYLCWSILHDLQLENRGKWAGVM